MAAIALRLNCRDLERDVAPADSLMVSCASCDPDNPKAVPRAKCRSCRGKGEVPAALASIVTEIHKSRLELLRGGKKNYDAELDE